MGRKTQITREMILEAAFEILDESGIGSVAIKNIAARLNCSTQPVSWQFGSMQELKKELFWYSARKFSADMERLMKGRPAIEAFFVTGMNYISIACDHPNVFRFVNVDDPMDSIGERLNGDTSIFAMQFDEVSAGLLAKEYGMTEETASEIIRDTVLYTHGLAVMMMYDNYRLPKETACEMIYRVGERFMKAQGYDINVDYEKMIKEFFG